MIEWKNSKRKLKDLIPYDQNPRTLSKKEHRDLKKSIESIGFAEIPAINTDNMICAGHMRVQILLEKFGPEYEIDVRVPNKKLTPKQFQEYLIRSNKNTGSWDMDDLANFNEINDLIEWGWTKDELGLEEKPKPDKPPFIKIVSETIEDLENLKAEIEPILEKYQGLKVKIG
jgi:hypothetical protein